MGNEKATIFQKGDCMHQTSGVRCQNAAAGYIVTDDKRRRRLCDHCANLKGVTHLMRPFQPGTINLFETMLLLAVAAWCVFMFIHAIETRAEGVSFALGADVHGGGMAGDIQYSRTLSRKWDWYVKMAYVNGSVAGSGGGVFKWNKKFYTQAGIGAREPDEYIGTDWHYDLVPLGYCFTSTGKSCVEWSHRSNCKSFMDRISDKCWFVLPRGNASKPNRGLDVIQWRVRW